MAAIWGGIKIQNLKLLHYSSREIYVYHREPPTGYLLPDDMEQVHIKMTRQTDNEHLDIFFITIGIAFYCEMHRRMSTMDML
jgi:hypothetical protein